jgi:mono/diheme cytochrome c family protein
VKGEVFLVLVGGAAAALLAAMAIVYVGDRAGKEEISYVPARDPDLINRGAYLAKLGDCAACHSIPGRPAFSGGLNMGVPIGAIYSTNITPDLKYGIGRFAFADFDRALRYGIADGHSLYPAMPFTSYFNTKPEDVRALYAYFRYAVTPASIPNRASDIPFPLSMRWPLTYWRWLFASKPAPFTAPAGLDRAEAQGAYFVDGLGHCGECHTPRNAFMQLKAVSRTGGAQYLSGAVIESYFAPSLRNDGAGSLKDWSEKELAEFLRTGANSHGIAFGSMSDVIIHSTQYMSEADAGSTAHYLKSLDSQQRGRGQPFVYDSNSHKALKRGDASAEGAMVYLDNCVACHRPNGRGYERVFPALAGNPVYLSGRNVVHTYLAARRGRKASRLRASSACDCLGGSERISVNTNTFRAFHYAAEHAYRFVTEPKLLKAVCSNTHVQPEIPKNRAPEIRCVLRDYPDNPSSIKTLRHRDYSFTVATCPALLPDCVDQRDFSCCKLTERQYDPAELQHHSQKGDVPHLGDFKSTVLRDLRAPAVAIPFP